MCVNFIILFGLQESGKTTTLNILTTNLLFKEINIGNIIKIAPMGDNLYVFEYKNKKLLILTAGDEITAIKKRLEQNIDKVDIVICAVRKNHKRNTTYNGLKKLLKDKKWNIIKEFEKTKSLNNNEMAQNIKKELDSFIN